MLGGKLWRAGLAVGLLTILAACGGEDGTEPPVVATVTVSPTYIELSALGETHQLAVTVLDQHGQPVTGSPVTWASSDNAVAAVTEIGLVTAIGNGRTTVTATSGTATGTVAVTVAQLPVSMDVSPAADTLFAVGDTLRFTARPVDANGNIVANATIAWSSTDEAVATIDATGLATAVGDGSADITAMIRGLTAAAAVTVAQRPARVAVAPSADTILALGDTLRISARPLDANDNIVANATIAWSSADEAVATVDSTGLVTSIGNGTADITATAGQATGGAAITVSQLFVAMDVVPAAKVLFSLGDTLRLVATGFDPNGHPIADLGFTWTSNDPAVAAVDSHGLVTAVRTGSTDVFATSGELRDSAGVTVAQLASEVRVTPAVDTLDAVGDTVRLAAVALDRNGHEVEDTDYIWYAPHPAVVTVDADGLVTATGPGTGEIRVRATRAGANYIGVAIITVRDAARARLPSQGDDRRTDPSR